MPRPSVLILAAGKGERMQSDLPKVLHRLGGRPLLSHVLETARGLRPRKTIVVVGHQAGRIRRQIPHRVDWVIQKRQQGTADAVRTAWPLLKGLGGPLYILYGDVPLLSRGTLLRMQEAFERERCPLALLTARPDDPTGYGRVLRNGTGRVTGIVEEREATDEERRIREVNTGVYLAETGAIEKSLGKIQRRPSGEYYLTDLVQELVRDGQQVATVEAHEDDGWEGINTPWDLARAEERLRWGIRRRWMDRGVTLVHPESIFIDPEVSLEAGVVLHPGVILAGRCRVRRGTEILPYSVVEGSRIGEGAKIGPFAHLRPGSVVGDRVHIGNYVELKKTVMKRGAKANHLSYLGDAVVGEETNVGAGTITCNYDGFKKNKTVLGRRVFVGSDVQFVAPVRVQDGAWIGAGTTVTKNVPSGALALSRVEQKNIEGWVPKRIRRERRK